LDINTTEQRRLAADLPAGKLFKSGNAFVPFVSQKVFDQIVRLAPDEVAKAAKRKKLRVVAGTDAPDQVPVNGASTPPVEAHYPADRTKLKVGSHVLAHELDEEGWYVAIVIELK